MLAGIFGGSFAKIYQSWRCGQIRDWQGSWAELPPHGEGQVVRICWLVPAPCPPSCVSQYSSVCNVLC